METQSDRLHPGSLICDADKRLIFAPSFQLGSGGLGISQRYGTVWDGIRAKIIIFSESRRSASGKGRRTSSPARSCLVPSLDRGDASARVGSRSGRRDPQYDSEARAQPRCRWPLETAQPHLWSRPELCQKAPILDLYKRIREGRCWAPMIPSFSTNQKTSIPPAAGNRRRSRRRPSARRALSRSTFAELLGLLSGLACPSRPGLRSLLRPERHGSVQTRPQNHEPHVFWITNHDSAHRGQKSRPAVPNGILTQTPADARM
jgi:hypothetical protein